MKNPARILAWRGPPLALQIMGLLLGGLVVAQIVTLVLTLFLPPEPPAKYGLADIAASLRDQPGGHKGLQRRILTYQPVMLGRGWLSSPSSHDNLAQLLGVAPDRVTLAFYTPLPFAGTVGAFPSSRPAVHSGSEMPAAQQSPVSFSLDWEHREPEASATLRPAVLWVTGRDASPASLLKLVDAGAGPGGPGGGFPSGGFPGGGFPGGGFPGGGFPGGAAPTAPNGSSAPVVPPAPAPTSLPPSNNGAGQSPVAPSSSPLTASPPAVSPPAEPRPQALQVPTPSFILPSQSSGDSETRHDTTRPTARRTEVGQPTTLAPSLLPQTPPLVSNEGPSSDNPISSTANEPLAVPVGASSATASDQHVQRTGLQGAIDRARNLFGLAPSPFVEGDFIASLALPDGRWIVVQPESGELLSPWQERVLLWFAIAFGITAPIGWLFARRLSQPLARFAEAAGQLGRDPSIALAALDGPAEIGRAAHAFNLMQKRLRSFVDDRTAMVGAISHDLRTPLTRMRFRIEDTPDNVRSGMLEDLDEMEEMITSVLAFIRDASTPGARERLDLRTLLDDVAEDAAVIGANVPIEAGSAAMVEVEVMGMRRVLVNLLENALKYGDHARIELTVLQDEAIAAIIDDGPGLPDEELEQVFQPFYRTASAKASGVPGTGLGLAVCRSIARAHGGDVRLCRSSTGFRAEVRVPLVYDAVRALAA